MNHTSAQSQNEVSGSTYTFKDFLPLILIFLIIIFFTFSRQIIQGWDLHRAMRDFMASFFIIFGGFKLLNLHGFAQAYRTYDIIAQKSLVYAYIYPFIEITLGLAYLFNIYPTTTNIITFVLMAVSSIGVAKELQNKKTIICACLGTVFRVPMTYVTLAEDLIMAIMALIMLIIN